MKKINLKYLKDNLDLKKLTQELDKQESSGGDDIIKDAVLDLKNAFEKKLLTNTFNDEFFFNIKRMNNINLR